MTVEEIASVAHEANRAFCKILGDTSQVPWDDAPDWQKRSSVTGVKFLLANPDAPPGPLHNSWLDEKRAEGWAYGEVKDPLRKTHPCFVPFEALPAEQQLKDYLFTGVVKALTAMSPEHIPIVE